MEEKDHGVSVTILCPGAMCTEMIRDGFGADPNEGKKSKWIKFSEPKDLARSMVSAAVLRVPEHYTDVTLRVIGVLRALFPQTVDRFFGPISKQMHEQNAKVRAVDANQSSADESHDVKDPPAAIEKRNENEKASKIQTNG